MDMSKYRDLFLSEAREHFQGMNDCLLVLEKNPAASDSIDELFRHAHSVKGMAASMGFGKISELAHRMEDMMDSIRQGRARVTRPFMDFLFQGLDHLEEMISAVEKDASLEGFDFTDYLARGQTILEGKAETPPKAEPPPSLTVKTAPPPPAVPAPPPGVEAPPSGGAEASSPREGILVRFRISPDSLVPAARAYLTVRKLEKMGKVAEMIPSLEKIREGMPAGDVILRILDSDAEAVRKTLADMSEMGEFSITPPSGGIPADGPFPAPEAAAPPPPVSPATRPPPAAPPPAPRPSSSKTVRISTDLLDTFINLVGELIVTKSRLKDLLAGSRNRPVDEGLTRLDHLVGILHSEVMKVRMMPLETVTARLPRVVRDLAKSRGKEVELSVEGAQIELDRAILEELGDPLIHILRNAVDHGLEEAAGRRKAGKDPVGHINIRAYRERDMVHMEINDDGRGMDLAKIRAKAVEKGIIDRDQASLLSEEDAIMLVCRPGFSTLDVATDVSGRGVGMDVVRSTVESLGGNLVIRSRTGEGTTFLLKLPLTVAIVRMLLVRVRSHIFAIPITRVVRTVRASLEEIQQSQRKRYLTLGEELVPLHEVRELLALPGSFPERGAVPVVLVELTNRNAGLLVDEILGQEDIVVKPLCYPLEHLVRFSGITVLGDGRIVPILDLKNLIV